MKNNKCFCPLTNSLIERSICSEISNNKNLDFKIKSIPNRVFICKSCKYHKIYDEDSTMDLSQLMSDLKRIKDARGVQ